VTFGDLVSENTKKRQPNERNWKKYGRADLRYIKCENCGAVKHEDARVCSTCGTED
jgi:uncharacterized OB-fold protein